MRKHLFLVLLAVIIAAVAVAFATARKDSVKDAGSSAGRTSSPIATAGERDDHGDRGDVVTTGLFRSIAKRENPVVVAITTQSRVKTPDVTKLFGNDDFFKRFFGAPQMPREQVQQGLGSGFLITSTGEILTNNHVVAGAEQIRVALFSDEHRTYPAAIVGRDPLTDSALIKLKDGPADLPTAALGDSDALDPGDWVMAIGNPFQLGHTVTVGVISYNGRPFATTEGRFQNMLQTDASINPGNPAARSSTSAGRSLASTAPFFQATEVGATSALVSRSRSTRSRTFWHSCARDRCSEGSWGFRSCPLRSLRTRQRTLG